MANRLTEGNYDKFGLQLAGDTVIFTFAGEKEDTCAILLYGKNHDVVERIEVPREYCRGSIRSVGVKGLSLRHLRYNYEINGCVKTDVYARRIIGRERWGDLSRAEAGFAVCGGAESPDFDWKGDTAPEVPRNKMVMYKLHVRGFSMDAGIRSRKRGTFVALQEKIPYLKQLGITTLEVMPVYEFEELIFHEPAAVPSYVKWEPKEGDLYQPEERRAKQLNYWGYTAGNYFAVKSSYSSTPDAAREWKELIRELHANGMECVMEMYFDEQMNQNVILDALRYWVSEFHVDGFHLLGRSVPVTAIAQDMLLSRTKIFHDRFEPFLFEQKKRYPHLYLYNDDYYYPIRKVLNQQGGQLAEFANQQRRQHEMLGFVNFVAGNNGFTLADLFSYGQKHNEINGEDNSDGNDWNYSTNCGVEGKTTRRAVLAMRERKIRNAFAIIMAAQGVPLFLAGDEFGNSQEGNNNAYCQDNRIGWLNWKQQDKFAWLGEFVAQLVQFRQQHPIIARELPMALSDVEHRGFPDLSYHGDKAWMSDFPVDRQAVGMMYCGRYAAREDGTQDDFVYVGYNFGYSACGLAMPKLPEKKKWYLVMDTAAGRDAFLKEETCMEDGACVTVESQAIVYLVGK